eukprot:364569-Chlamydomonas_euryale.AAC.14
MHACIGGGRVAGREEGHAYTQEGTEPGSAWNKEQNACTRHCQTWCLLAQRHRGQLACPLRLQPKVPPRVHADADRAHKTSLPGMHGGLEAAWQILDAHTVSEAVVFVATMWQPGSCPCCDANRMCEPGCITGATPGGRYLTRLRSLDSRGRLSKRARHSERSW